MAAESAPRKTYVLHASVMLADPNAVTRFGKHRVVVPVGEIYQLTSKKNDPELGGRVLRAISVLDELRDQYGGLGGEVPVNAEGGTLRVEPNHVEKKFLPLRSNPEDKDSRILSVCASLVASGQHVIIVSQDPEFRVVASAKGMRVEKYRFVQARDDGWSGIVDADVSDETLAAAYQGTCRLELPEAVPVNSGVRLQIPTGQRGLFRLMPSGLLEAVESHKTLYGMNGRSDEQRLAINLLADQNVGIVSMGGRAGTGKTALALCAGLQAVRDELVEEVIVFRSIHAVGGQDIGALPGTEQQKMDPWAEAVDDLVKRHVSLGSREWARRVIKVRPYANIRGRTLSDCMVIVDEAQDLERDVLLTALTRTGPNCRMFLTHDVSQRDNLRVGRYDGIARVVEDLMGQPLFAHVTLTKSERSPVAAMVGDRMDNGGFVQRTPLVPVGDIPGGLEAHLL